MQNCASVDCARGREIGCQTFCCRLLVRLDEDERAPGCGNFVEKAGDGYCTHLNREHHLCGIWDRRPRVCRAYDCNNDFMLQVALRHPFRNITELARLAVTAYIPREYHIRVPPVQDRRRSTR
ncbi:MAG TPA: hypothetical protein VKC56_10705 [Gallionellaceae bacterium]|nr:hypothetical protein [Gallionellaceae bacterium]